MNKIYGYLKQKKKTKSNRACPKSEKVYVSYKMNVSNSTNKLFRIYTILVLQEYVM